MGIECFLLETGEMVEQHTAVNLANYLDEVLDRWNLPITQVSAVVTDNTTNITATVARLERQHIGCFSHTLQLSLFRLHIMPLVLHGLRGGHTHTHAHTNTHTFTHTHTRN